jgi:phage FluMu protein Com
MEIKRKCPKCETVLTDEWIIKQAASIQGSKTNKKRAAASRENGKLGGRPKRKKTKGAI